jgi:hypothetical protein
MRLTFTLIWIAILLLALAAMWWGWRARARRDAGVLGAAVAPVGEALARFGGDRSSGTHGGLMYVSTTPVGEPLTRVAAPGLRYRGAAEIVVQQDGVTIEVVGERPVHLDAAQVRGSGSASRRVGKAVEAGGLALLRWQDEDRELESSFRFADRAEQQRFAVAIDRIAAHRISTSPSTSQEDAQ